VKCSTVVILKIHYIFVGVGLKAELILGFPASHKAVGYAVWFKPKN